MISKIVLFADKLLANVDVLENARNPLDIESLNYQTIEFSKIVNSPQVGGLAPHERQIIWNINNKVTEALKRKAEELNLGIRILSAAGAPPASKSEPPVSYSLLMPPEKAHVTPLNAKAERIEQEKTKLDNWNDKLQTGFMDSIKEGEKILEEKKPEIADTGIIAVPKGMASNALSNVYLDLIYATGKLQISSIERYKSEVENGIDKLAAAYSESLATLATSDLTGEKLNAAIRSVAAPVITFARETIGKIDAELENKGFKEEATNPIPLMWRGADLKEEGSSMAMAGYGEGDKKGIA